MSLPKGKQAQTGIQSPYQPGPRIQNSRGPEEYIARPVLTAAASYPGPQQQTSQLRQPPMQPGPGQLVHDMSKQHYPQQPCMPGVSSQSPQQQQTMQHVSQQQQQAVASTQMVYNPAAVRQQQQQVQARPQSGMTVISTASSQGGASYYQQNQARSIQTTRPMNPGGAAPAPQPAQSYYPHQVYIANQTHMSAVPQTPMMNYQQPQVAMQIRQYQSQYQTQGTQQMFIPYHPTTMYFPTQMSVQQHGRQQSMPQIVQPQAPKERKLIKIQDPVNEKEISIDELAQADSRQTPPMSGSSSARGTPPSNSTPPPVSELNDVPAQFAQQVAAVAAMGPMPVAQPQMPIAAPQLPVVPSPEAPLPPAQPIAVARSPPPPAQPENLGGAYVSVPQAPPVTVVPEDVPAAKVTDAVNEEDVSPQNEAVVAALEERNAEKDAVVDVVPEESHKKAVVVEVENAPVPVLAAAVPETNVPVTAAHNAVLSDVSVGEKQVPLQQLHTRHPENGDVPQQHQQPETEAAAKDNTKKGKNKKRRDLNKKGEAKEGGGEMDAFVSVKDEPTPQLPAAPIRHNAAPPAQPVPAALPAQVQQPQQQQRNPEVSEEERKVAVKNEENAKVTKELEQKPWNDAKKTQTTVIEPPITISITQAPIIPPFQYKEDQWSPMNPDGKKQYDRSFLLAQQDKPLSIKKPEGLPNLEVIKEAYSKGKHVDRAPGYGTSRSIGSVPDFFTPTFVKAPNRGSFQGRMSQTGRKQPEQKKISLSLNKDVKLHEAENAWKASYRNEKDVDSETAETETLLKCVRSILNKLTPQNFESLVGQVRGLEISNEERFSKVIDLVFEKAIGEPNFSTAYARMCKELAMMRVASASNPEETVNFRKLLINRCQKEFEKDKHDELVRDARRQKSKADNEEKRKQLIEELEEAETKARRRSLGNIRFIGELFKLEILTAKIMHECLNKLINAGDEDSLECLCRLLTTIGKELENTKSERNEPSANVRMNSYFNVLANIVKEKKTSSRVRFMLQDVCDLRDRKWVPRRDENNPKTLDQIKKEAEHDLHQQNFSIQQHAKKPEDRDRRRRGGPPVSYNEVGSGSWSTVSGGKQRVDVNTWKLTKLPTVNDDIQLGPSSTTSWGRGSSGGLKSNVQQENVRPPSMMANRFSAFAETTSDKKSNRPPPTPSTRGRGGSYAPMPQRPAKHMPGATEKEQALAAARVVYNTEDNRESRHSRESSVASEDLRQTTSTDSPFTGDPNMNEEELEKKCASCIDEYLKHLEFQDVVQTVITLCSSTTISHFLNVAFNRVLERTSNDRLRTGQLLHHLLKKSLVKVEQFTQELTVIFGSMEDIIVDVPHAWDYLGEIVSQTMIDGTVSFKAVTDTLHPLVKSGSALTCITRIVHHLGKAATKPKVREMWQTSRLNLSEFLGEGQRTPPELEFLVGAASTTVQSSAPVKFDLKYVSKELIRLLNSGTSNEEMFDWVDHHVDLVNSSSLPFIRALVCAVADSAISCNSANEYELNADTFKMRMKLMLKYVDNNETRELQVLYALQAVVKDLQFPKNILHEMFQILCENDIISDEGFLHWKDTTDPLEVEGHKVAVMSVKTFMEWLVQSGESSDAKESAAN